MDELTFKGESFISSKRAAQLTSYTKDYVGQLCRAEKLECKLVGRNWYVKLTSLLGHKQNSKKHAVDKKELSFYAYEPLQYVNESSNNRTTTSPSHERMRKLRYKSDNRLLNPVPNKKQAIEGVVRQKDQINVERQIISSARTVQRTYAAITVQSPQEKKLPYARKTSQRKQKRSIGVKASILAIGSTLAFVGLLIMLFATEGVVNYSAFPGGMSATASHLQLVDAATLLEMFQ